MNIKENFQKDKLLTTVTLILLAIGFICIAYVLFSNYQKSRDTKSMGNLDCVKETQMVQAKDDFMNGVVSKDQTVKLLPEFYNCNNVNKGDLVYFRFSQQIEPVVRWVRGTPGDRYDLTEDSNEKGSWHITINGEKVMAGGSAYVIKSNSVPPLKTYAISRGGILRNDEYILLSNVSPGLSDSSNLGLIKKNNLVGKIILK